MIFRICTVIVLHDLAACSMHHTRSVRCVSLSQWCECVTSCDCEWECAWLRTRLVHCNYTSLHHSITSGLCINNNNDALSSFKYRIYSDSTWQLKHWRNEWSMVWQEAVWTHELELLPEKWLNLARTGLPAFPFWSKRCFRVWNVFRNQKTFMVQGWGHSRLKPHS